jgi:hypothetical protein
MQSLGKYKNITAMDWRKVKTSNTFIKQTHKE